MGDMWMIERRQGLGLALEPREPIAVAREVGRQHLERHVAVEFRIARAIHLAHAAGADQGDDFEGPESVPAGSGIDDSVRILSGLGEDDSTVSRSPTTRDQKWPAAQDFFGQGTGESGAARTHRSSSSTASPTSRTKVLGSGAGTAT